MGFCEVYHAARQHDDLGYLETHIKKHDDMDGKQHDEWERFGTRGRLDSVGRHLCLWKREWTALTGWLPDLLGRPSQRVVPGFSFTVFFLPRCAPIPIPKDPKGTLLKRCIKQDLKTYVLICTYYILLQLQLHSIISLYHCLLSLSLLIVISYPPILPMRGPTLMKVLYRKRQRDKAGTE